MRKYLLGKASLFLFKSIGCTLIHKQFLNISWCMIFFFFLGDSFFKCMPQHTVHNTQILLVYYILPTMGHWRAHCAPLIVPAACVLHCPPLHSLSGPRLMSLKFLDAWQFFITFQSPEEAEIWNPVNALSFITALLQKRSEKLLCMGLAIMC